ncbi:hypothetical protein OBBRIDRAFT_803834 [Obba rivulosa]|uniref:Uncharacterized protein n=1 Tax=Obba rivulosa TaxID=1052685 RepID=A0A8E2AU44_9APHY|nr:hypothetical protein OBBRIDRAFT_803834 [Obba rivulosa]
MVGLIRSAGVYCLENCHGRHDADMIQEVEGGHLIVCSWAIHLVAGVTMGYDYAAQNRRQAKNAAFMERRHRCTRTGFSTHDMGSHRAATAQSAIYGRSGSGKTPERRSQHMNMQAQVALAFVLHGFFQPLFQREGVVSPLDGDNGRAAARILSGNRDGGSEMSREQQGISTPSMMIARRMVAEVRSERCTNRHGLCMTSTIRPDPEKKKCTCQPKAPGD